MKRADPADTIHKVWTRLIAPRLIVVDECHIFMGSRDPRGYGQVWLRSDPNVLLRTHRVAYEYAHGPIPNGAFVLHSCDRPPCCNPEHLRIGTIADNMRDALDRDRVLRGERHQDARFTTEDVRAMRRMRANGQTFTAIAEQFGTMRTTVSNICHRYTWKHIP
jgi:hypothetical protein